MLSFSVGLVSQNHNIFFQELRLASLRKILQDRVELRLNRKLKTPREPQMASSPDSSVRMRMASSIDEMKIFPSPTCPVFATFNIVSTTLLANSLETITSIFIFGRKSIWYSEPR